MTTAPSPEEQLANWEGIYAEFRKATPSSPVWYQIADIAIGVLLADKIDVLKAAVASAHPPGGHE